MKKKLFVAIIFSLLPFFSISVIAAETKNTTPTPYSPEEFPSVFHDFRRAEIITLGAMPFVTFNVSLGYSFGSFVFHNFDTDYFVNPFASGSDAKSYSTDEQIGIILTSLGISLGIGITDFIVHSVKRSHIRRKTKMQKTGNIKIETLKNDSNATKIPLPVRKEEMENMENEEVENPNEIIIDGDEIID